jgi:molybdate transport system regulatory protein
VGTLEEIKPAAKVWLERGGRPVLGHGGAAILEAIGEERSIARAAQRIGMSYRYVWSYLNRMGRAVGEPVVETFKGGREGGGGAKLTQMGEHLLREYRRAERYISDRLRDEECWRSTGSGINSRNRLKGLVKRIERNGVLAKVEIEIGAPMIITALISKEAFEEMNIKIDDEVEAIIKATDVDIKREINICHH